jgi:hypothetical protein
MRSANSNQPSTAFSRAERRALATLRDRYRQDHDLLTRRELANLHFVRWLCETDRLRS